MKFKITESFLTEHTVLIHDELNPVLWDGMELRPEVKDKILAIVEEFQSTLDIPLDILDINLVGSNASYNYTDKSDVDVHIVTDFEEYGYPMELVNAAMQAFKKVFNDTYDINFDGYNVELYVEDVNTSPNSNGIYSVLNDTWIKVPAKLEPVEIELEPEYSDFCNRIDAIAENGTGQDVVDMMNELKMLRRNSLAVDGEFGKGNLIFKQLRNNDYIAKLKDRKIVLASEELSI